MKTLEERWAEENEETGFRILEDVAEEEKKEEQNFSDPRLKPWDCENNPNTEQPKSFEDYVTYECIDTYGCDSQAHSTVVCD